MSLVFENEKISELETSQAPNKRSNTIILRVLELSERITVCRHTLSNKSKQAEGDDDPAGDEGIDDEASDSKDPGTFQIVSLLSLKPGCRSISSQHFKPMDEVPRKLA